jgi:hypothetical protein
MEEKRNEKTRTRKSMSELNSEKFFYAVRNVQNGPVPLAELKTMAARGQLKRTDKIWKQGMPSWAAASSVPEIFEDLRPGLNGSLPDPVGSIPPPLRTEAADTTSFTAAKLADNDWRKAISIMADKSKMVSSLILCLIILFPPIVPAYIPSGNPGLDAVVHTLAEDFQESDRLAGRNEFVPYWEKTQFTFIFAITKNDRIQIPILAGELALVGLLWVGLPALKARNQRQKRSPES